jgi:hypothetical protein
LDGEQISLPTKDQVRIFRSHFKRISYDLKRLHRAHPSLPMPVNILMTISLLAHGLLRAVPLAAPSRARSELQRKLEQLDAKLFNSQQVPGGSTHPEHPSASSECRVVLRCFRQAYRWVGFSLHDYPAWSSSANDKEKAQRSLLASSARARVSCSNGGRKCRRSEI